MATTAETTAEDILVFTRQLGGVEDLIFGFGTESQIRNGNNVVVTHINASHIPFDSTRSVKDVIDEILVAQSSI